jgi:hypothetical protein
MGSSGINNQCHENHTTTTLLAWKPLISSTRMCQKLLRFEPPYLDGVYWKSSTATVFLPNKYLHRYRERKRVVVVAAWSE